MNFNAQDCLQFILDSEDERFLGDTNIDIGDRIFIALAYPQIEVFIGLDLVKIFCEQENFYVEPDTFSIIEFLKKFPEVCVKIVQCHPAITEKFLRFMREQM